LQTQKSSLTTKSQRADNYETLANQEMMEPLPLVKLSLTSEMVITNKLGALDPLLKTALTEDIISQWKGQTEGNKHYATLANVENLIKKVIGADNKVKTDFLATLKKLDSEITDIGQLFTKKEPQEVIKLILKYEYDQLTDGSETADEKKAKTQQERKIKKLLGKTASETLKAEEITQVLYEVAIGSKTLSSKALKADLSEYETSESPAKENAEVTKKPFHHKIGGKKTSEGEERDESETESGHDEEEDDK
ncbi:4289_t:CDS:2, partial [Gigaspora margarita]